MSRSLPKTECHPKQVAQSFSRTLRKGWESTALATVILFAPILCAQETTLHVDVKLVNIFVNVTDANGAIVGGLKKEDFAVTEDGGTQKIAVFERQSELPL